MKSSTTILSLGTIAILSILIYNLRELPIENISSREPDSESVTESASMPTTEKIETIKASQEKETHEKYEKNKPQTITKITQKLTIARQINNASASYFSSQNSLKAEEKRKEIIMSLASNPEAILFITSVYRDGIDESSELYENQAEIRLMGIHLLDQVQKYGNELPILDSIHGVNRRILEKDETKGLDLDFRDLVSAWSSNRYQDILANPDVEIAKLGSEIGNLDEMANGLLSGMTKSVPKEVLWPFLNDNVISVHLKSQTDS